ncbi:beta-actin [Aspergillus homomorphus CBS 101889]|uniref:Beta-actin n=1 Tax=Aspergillus homomorphus (strain CBS 101889) TaxID=1450537 RepID=A0A395HLZ9_ASPHC|nr:beta-actin [Aspergillus homomorphus CBS 101889]RAL08790.1 beta-actin [Aspergillus homomorphus CBS 101889]
MKGISPLPAIVIDNGSGYIKAGFAGDEKPRAVIPSVVGHPHDVGVNGYCVGGEAMRCNNLCLTKPIQHGLVTDWDDLERLWDYTIFDGLHTTPQDRNVMITQAPLTTLAERRYKAQTLFESFGVAACHFASQPFLSLFSGGRSTGLSLDIDTIDPAVWRLDFGGRDITDYLLRLFVQLGYDSMGTNDARMVKEDLCFVAINFNREIRKLGRRLVSYTLPNRRNVLVGEQRFKATETIFDPYRSGLDDGIHNYVFDSIMKCEPEIQPQLFGNIVLSGGTAMIRNLPGRFAAEISKLTDHKVNVYSPQNARNSVFVGASMLASLPQTRKLFIRKHEYEEYGASILARKSLG